MARIARVVVPGYWHHITQRGNHQQAVFYSDADREFYLRLLKQYGTRYDFQLTGYCLMGNHVHLLGIPHDARSLARAVGRTHNDYARWLNFRRGANGHVWQNRFYSCTLDETHRWLALRYVEWNPVQAGLVIQAESWRWSSAAAHTTGHDARTLLDWADWARRWDPDSWTAALHEGVYGAAWADRLREATRTGRPAGDGEFVKRVEEMLSRSLQPQKRGPKAHAGATSGQMNLVV